MNKLYNWFLSIWNSPVCSKVIATGILSIIPFIYVMFKSGDGETIKEILYSEVSLKFYELMIFATAFGILLFFLILNWLADRKKRNLLFHENILINEYDELKMNQDVFNYFDEISKRVNSRLHLDEIPEEIKGYFIAKEIIFNPMPGYGIYAFTAKGDFFLKRRAIEIIENGT